MLLTAFNILMSKWNRNPNVTPESQSVSLAGSTENHFSSVWQEDISYLAWTRKLQKEVFPFEFSNAQTLMIKTLYEARNTQKNYFQPEKYFESQVGLQWCMETQLLQKIIKEKPYYCEQSHPSWSCQWDPRPVVSRKIVICTCHTPTLLNLFSWLRKGTEKAQGRTVCRSSVLHPR